MGDFYLKISESELSEVANGFLEYGKQLDETLTAYHKILSDAATNGVSSGQTHEALVTFMGYVEKLCGIGTGVGEKFVKIQSKFISEIASTDKLLYESTANVMRDYSQQEYDHLFKCLDDPWCDITDSIGDWFYGLITKAVKLLKWESAKKYLNECHKMLLDYNDETAQGLNRLFTDVHSIDRAYGKSIPGTGEADFYTCCFSYALGVLCSIRDLVRTMSEIINPQNGVVTSQAINTALSGAFEKMLGDYDTFLALPDKRPPLTVEEIKAFASQNWATDYFWRFEYHSADFVQPRSGDAVIMGASLMFDMPKNLFVQGGYDEYYQNVSKTLLMKSLAEAAEQKKLYDESEYQQLLKNAKTFLKQSGKFSGGTYELMNNLRISDGELILNGSPADGKLLLDGRTVEAKQLKGLIKSLDNAGEILKYGEKGLEFVATLAADYTVNMEILESYIKNNAGNDEAILLAAEIADLYDKKFGAWTKQAVQRIEEEGIDIVSGIVGKAIPVLGAVEKTVDGTLDMTGLGDRAEGVINAVNYRQLQQDSRAAYRHARETFLLADPADENYTELANDLTNCFNLHKQNVVETYEAMALASDGTEKSYYLYCADRTQELSMRDNSAAQLMSYDDYIQTYETAN